VKRLRREIKNNSALSDVDQEKKIGQYFSLQVISDDKEEGMLARMRGGE
jgi:hypothetical protein